ncbi:hypothetical protein KBK19_19700 [Microvirga sp. STR05]|uniref:Uncharacterized protein n=1 Tax=Hymenobacter duratus TaxID=2771356 RepID=A0ABR8JK80_9BACT|nr:hypothetical protein [Hymenobacter duratus]MBD2717274.1 hypothetical protein [Hymenobacter duratus]MBR7952194.1 hypothetical protein [Microvirga sp. STR05]
MRYRAALLLLGALLPLTALAWTTWSAYAVDTQLSVQLPSPPQEIDLAKQGLSQPNLRLFIANDEVGMYQIIRMQLTPEMAAQVHSPADRQSFYDGFLRSLVGDLKGQLLTRTTFPTAAGEGVEVKFRSVHKGTGLKTVKFSRGLLVGDVCYGFNFLPRDVKDTAGTSGQAERQQFFSSITATLRPAK